MDIQQLRDVVDESRRQRLTAQSMQQHTLRQRTIAAAMYLKMQSMQKTMVVVRDAQAPRIAPGSDLR
jgi:hypothetical protein